MLTKIKNVRIVDGSGNPGTIGDVAIRDDRFLAVGTVPELAYDEEIDGTGLTAAPGFIDTHSHSDLMVLAQPSVLPKIHQGITTEVLGQDGISMAPLPPEYIAEWRGNISGLDGDSDEIDWNYRNVDGYLNAIAKSGPATNVCYLVPHGNIRLEAMGMAGRPADDADLEKMKKILHREMRAGAIGLSSGLIYIPCTYAKTEELIELCRVVKEYDGVFVVHERSEADDIIASTKEIIRIGKESGVHIHFSHFKVAGRKNGEKIDTILNLLDEAEAAGVEISFDQYPYVAGSTMLGVVIPSWAHEDGKLLERLHNPADRARIKADMENGIPGWDNFIDFAGWENIIVSGVKYEKNRDAVGKNLLEYAKYQKKDKFDALFDLLYEDKNGASLVDFYGKEEHLARFMRRPEMNLCTDGLMMKGLPHPRVYGSFARMLGKYSREEKVVSLETAVYKMTHKAAMAMSLRERGLIQPGYFADMVLFDAQNITEKGTYTEPEQYPDGILYVMVSGRWAIRDGQDTGVRSGQVIRRQGC